MQQTVQVRGPPLPSMPARMPARLSLPALAVVLPFVLWALLPVGSLADPSSGQIQRKIDKAESLIGGHRRHERVLTSDITAFTHRIDGLQSDITRLAGRQAKLQSSLDAERLQLARVQQDLRTERLRLARLKARLLEARRILAQRLVEQYKSDRPDVVTVVLEANGFADLLEQTEFMQRASRQDARIMAAVTTAKAQATAASKRLAGLERKESRVTAQIQSQRDQVAGIKLGLVDKRDRLAGYRSQKQRLLSSSQSSRHRLEDDVASLRSQQRKIQAQLASAAGAPPPRPGPPRPRRAIRPGHR